MTLVGLPEVATRLVRTLHTIQRLEVTDDDGKIKNVNFRSTATVPLGRSRMFFQHGHQGADPAYLSRRAQ